jgi:hypothetical protein
MATRSKTESNAARADAKAVRSEPSVERPIALLKGSLPLLRAAWLALAIWILMLIALALHVLGVW